MSYTAHEALTLATNLVAASQSLAMEGYAATAVAYLSLTAWCATPADAKAARAALRDGPGKKFEKTAWENMVSKVCRFADKVNDARINSLVLVRDAKSVEEATAAMLSVFEQFNVNKPSHIDLFAKQDGLAPLDHTRKVRTKAEIAVDAAMQSPVTSSAIAAEHDAAQREAVAASFAANVPPDMILAWVARAGNADALRALSIAASERLAELQKQLDEAAARDEANKPQRKAKAA